MESPGPGQLEAFPAQLVGFVAHISWSPGSGWRVLVNTWSEGQRPGQGQMERYTSLTADEALDVLAAEVATRCDWLTA
jgi:hypothetical protein